MADFSSSLPIRTTVPGDVSVQLVDSQEPSYSLKVNANGSINVGNTTIVATPYVNNVIMQNKHVEYNFVIPALTKKVMFKTRNNSTLQFGFVPNTSGTAFITVPAGSSYTLEGVDSKNTITIYFQSPNDNETLEIISWI